MPGLVFVKRRWIIGSDDFVIPGTFLLTAHFIWLIIFVTITIKTGTDSLFADCSDKLLYHLFGQSILIIGCIIIELCIIKVSFRGSILNTKARSAINPLLCIRIVLFIIEVLWEIYGLFIIFHRSFTCSLYIKETIFSLKIYDLFIWLLLLSFVWCSYDPAGKSWVKMKRFQDSLKDKNSKYKYRRSKNSHRNWRHREVVREYEKTWDNRIRKFCCILDLKSNRENSLAEIAKLFSEFLRDLDVVPSSVLAGLSLMRMRQKATRQDRIRQAEENVFQFLSGVAITSDTDFLDLTHPMVVREVANLIHYLHYSLAIYGWPMYLMANSPTQWFKLLSHVKYCAKPASCCCFRAGQEEPAADSGAYIIDEFFDGDDVRDEFGDNCCLCNRAAIKQTLLEHNYRLIYLTYHVAVEKPPFLVAVDFEKMSIVVSIRGTLSLYDVVTDLKADYEILPVNPVNENWYGHKGMVGAADYIRSKLMETGVLNAANAELKARDPNASRTANETYPIILVGHSLGAGTAAILAILLRQHYSNVLCFAFAPPGGLLSEPAAVHSKDFVVSVVLGKDIVPRLGLSQMEKLRFDLIKEITHCEMTKWKIIAKSCCFGNKENLSLEAFERAFRMKKDNDPPSSQIDDVKKLSIHPNDESVSMTVHTPVYPPGSIIHLVRMHPDRSEKICYKKQPIIQALWADMHDFKEILISPTMVQDHMPDEMLHALESLLNATGPPKPPRRTSDSVVGQQSTTQSSSNDSVSGPPSKIIVETSFTDSGITSGGKIGGGEVYAESRLRRLRSLIRKGRAPLATPESSLSSRTDLDNITTQDAQSG